MRYREILEAPITAISYEGEDGQPFDRGTGFGPRDRKLMTAPGARERYIRAFRNTPHVFEIFFINSLDLIGDENHRNSENDLVDERAKDFGSGIYPEGFEDFPAKPGVIRHVQIANLSPRHDKLPMTPWILAHKIGHAIQDAVVNQKNDDQLSGKITVINRTVKNILDAHDYDGDGLPAEKPVQSWDRLFNFPEYFPEILTMRSARSKKLRNAFEQFAEIIAQYLVTGKVTMAVRDAVQPLVAKLNDLLRDLFEYLTGKVTLEV